MNDRVYSNSFASSCGAGLQMSGQITSVLAQLREEAFKCVNGAELVHQPIARLFAASGLDRTWLEDIVLDNYDRIESVAKIGQGHNVIPPIYHKVWLTSPVSPSLPPSDFITKLVESTFSIEHEWTLMFWTNNESVRLFLQKALEQCRISFLVLNVHSALQHDQLYPMINALIQDCKFVLAGDALKVAILNRFGGIYADLGLQLTSDVLNISAYLDYAFLIGHAVFLQTSFLAAFPRSPLLSTFANIMTRPESFPRDFIVMGTNVTATDEVRAFSGVGATLCMLLFLNRDAKALFLPTKSKHFQWEAKGSWYKADGNLGNRLISESSPTILCDQAYKSCEKEVLKQKDSDILDRIRIQILTLCEVENPNALVVPGAHKDLSRRVRKAINKLGCL